MIVAPPPADAPVDCRVCGEPVTADNRAQRDLHVGCVERAASLARRKERVLRHARPLTHDQLVERLARDRGVPDEPEVAGGDEDELETHELEHGDLAGNQI